MDMHFLRRAVAMRHWTFWEWVAYVALFVAALIIAADTGFRGSPDVMARLPEFFHSEWWGFAPAVLVVVATIILLLREFVFPNNKLRHQVTSFSMAVRDGELPKTSAAATAFATGAQPKKVFVNVSPSYLTGLYKNKTTAQGNDLAAAYIGKWMPVTGRVHDIFGKPGALHAQIYDNDETLISASFSAQESEKVSHFARGETIKVRGEIDSADPFLKLVNCDLVETDQAQAKYPPT
jgi:hypothetical protein